MSTLVTRSLTSITLVYRSFDGRRTLRQSLAEFFVNGYPDGAARGEVSDYLLDTFEFQGSSFTGTVQTRVTQDSGRISLRYPSPTGDVCTVVTLKAVLSGKTRHLDGVDGNIPDQALLV